MRSAARVSGPIRYHAPMIPMPTLFPDRTRFAMWKKCAVIAVLALALNACVTMPEDEPESSIEAAQAEQLYKQGELDRAAAAFLALADASGGDAQAHYRLRAAEAYADAGDLDAAARALGDVKRRRLHGDEPIRLDLLDAEIALKRGDAAQAQALLAVPDDSVPSNLRVRVLELRARAYVAAGDRYSAARTRAVLDHYLANADRDQNRKEIIATLAALDTDALKAHADALSPDDPLRPWIEQALRSKGVALARTMPRPSRQVGTMQPGESAAGA